MFFSPKSLSALALAALLAGPALAQETTTKTKTKRSTNRIAAATPAPPVAGPAGMPPPPPTGRPGKGPHGPGAHGPGGARAAQPLRQVQTLTGTLTRYTTNHEGFYDGFVLPLNGTETTVHFPLHMAKALMAAAKPGQSITFGAVSGHAGRQHGPGRDANTSGTTGAAGGNTGAATAVKPAQLEMVSVQSGGSTLLVQPPTRPTATEVAPVTTSISGRITERRTDDRGQLRGLVLADNTLLLMPPHVGEQLGDKLKVGETVQATGAIMPLRDGVVSATDVRRFHAETLTVGGVQFLMR